MFGCKSRFLERKTTYLNLFRIETVKSLNPAFVKVVEHSDDGSMSTNILEVYLLDLF